MIEILLPTIVEVAKYQKRAFSDESIVFQTKTDQFDFVSEVDKRSQQMILAAIEQQFPRSGIVAEEEGEDKLSQDGTWFLVDPLDGTANFKVGIPSWAISIGLIKDGAVEEGIISLPFTGETFYSQDVVPLVQPLEKLAAAQFYGIDSTFENLQLGLILKRRQLGAAVPTLLWCCDSRNRQRPRLDFALMGKGSLWDVCGAIAFLKQKGGSLIDTTGIDFTECSNVFQVLGGFKKIRTYNFRYVASASKQVAQEVYQRYLHNLDSG
ncbi:MAG: inositol monophosphatase family protein [Pleurocapsa sp. MO_192.B19]|nr:inositol monophosphatase family protein [Pleurocapsa sp. MO_192.B19]